MNEKQLALLDQLMTKGFAEETVTLLDGTLMVTLRTLPTESQLAVESSMKDVEGTPLFAVHTYSLRLLSYSIMSVTYKGKTYTFKTPADAESFIRSKPAILVDTLIAEHGKIEKAVTELIKGPDTVENFSKTPLADSAPK